MVQVTSLTQARRLPRAVVVVSVLTVVLVLVGAGTVAWGASLREDGRLLEGTTIAAVDVGGASVEEARALVEAELAARLDRVVEVTADGRRWETTPRELAATSDVDAVLDRALERERSAGLVDLLWGWLTGGALGPELDVTVDVPAHDAAAFVDGLAREVDREPQDAAVAWNGAGFDVTEEQPGRRVDREAAVAGLAAGLNGDVDRVELPVAAPAPRITGQLARRIADAVGGVVDGALGRPVTVTLEGSSRTVTPRDVGAVPVVEPLLAAALEAGDPAAVPADVQLEIPDDPLASLVDGIAAEHEQAPANAELDWTSTGIQITPERPGRAVPRDAATGDLRSALQGGGDRVELSLAEVAPRVTSASYTHTLLVNQAQRRLSYYRDGRLARQWPVAVGSGGHPTPTGVFTVGAKRYEPTWTNPSPDGWGADMPASIPPGPDNPLGPRAINWNQNGRDTLIRFHGTPNAASIGQAASKGCVRMYPADVIELYDLVPTGATIVSVAG